MLVMRRELGAMHVLWAKMESIDRSIFAECDLDCYSRIASCVCISFAWTVCQWHCMAGYDVRHHCLPRVDLWIPAAASGTHEAERSMYWRGFLVSVVGLIRSLLLLDVSRCVLIRVRH